jgi:hypothetical protein
MGLTIWPFAAAACSAGGDGADQRRNTERDHRRASHVGSIESYQLASPVTLTETNPFVVISLAARLEVAKTCAGAVS